MSTGKRAGSRRGPRRRPRFQPALLGYALGVTGGVLAWGYLVWAAIDFGATAREGNSTAWWFLALASIGAVACLFFGLMLIARALRHLGITQPPEPSAPPARSGEPAPAGGRRRADRRP